MINTRFFFDNSNQPKYLKDFTESVINDVSNWPSSSEEMIAKSLEFIKIILIRSFVDSVIIQNISDCLINLTSISGLFKNLKKVLQKKIIEIIFYIDIPNAVLSNLLKIFQIESISTTVKKYIISILGYCTYQKKKTLELERYLSFLLSVIVGFSMEDLQKFNIECQNSVSWSILNIFPNKLMTVPVDFAISQFDQFDGLDSALSILVPVIGKLLIQLRKLPVSSVLGILKLLGHFSNKHEINSSAENFGSEINQIVDLLSAVLLFSCSSSYKSVSHTCLDITDFHGFDNLEHELKTLAINLLCGNSQLLKLLVEKWINVLGEYKMNAVCVNSVLEILIALLKSPKLLPYLTEFKIDLQSIVKAFHSVGTTHIQQSLVEQLKKQVSLL